MADTKLSALTNLAAVTSDDLVYVVDDPAGTPLSRKATAGALATYVRSTFGADRITISTASFDQSMGGVSLGAGAAFAASANWITANRAISCPVIIERSMVVVKMFCLNGTAVSGNLDIGIYDSSGTLLVSSGSTAQAGTSTIQSFDIADTTLSAGIYYMAMVMDNGTGTVARSNATATACGGGGQLQQNTAFPLPNPATWAANGSAFIPLIGITARTVV